MKIALITDSIAGGSPGFAGYVMNLADALLDHREHEITLVHRRAHSFYERRPHHMVSRWSGVPMAAQVTLPPYLRDAAFDVVHDTYHFGPFVWPAPYARVLTIGDLTPVITNTHSLKRRWSHLLVAPFIARRAHRIVTFSESSKRDIVRLFHVPQDHVTVTYLAAAPQFRPLHPSAIETARVRLGLPQRYLLHVGTIEPRKNVERLLRAYAAGAPKIGEVPLVLVGRRGWGMAHLPGLIRELGIESRVRMREDISNDDLPAVYGGALALAYPSLYEGFGLPPLEAMQCGLPVLTSSVSSLPEVVGEAALIVDPLSVEAIARGLVALASDGSLRAKLSATGIERAGRFSWTRCASETLSAYEAAIESTGRRGEQRRVGAEV